MSETFPYQNLPVLLSAIRQEAGNGELVLAQNDGERRFCFLEGGLVHLRSDAAGEQFGNYLLRHGILDLPSLNELLGSDEYGRLGERVVQWGLMSLEERDAHLRCLQAQIMVHALEHPILHWAWDADSAGRGPDLPFELEPRHLVLNAFQEFNDPSALLSILRRETAWKWAGRPDLLDSLRDLPLTSGMAYAVSFLTAEPIGFETFCFLSNLGEEEAGRFLAALWALGTLVLSSGKLPSVTEAPRPLALEVPAAEPEPRLPFIMPPACTPFGPPKKRALEFQEDLIPCDTDSLPEFMDLDAETSLDHLANLETPLAIDMPPCGPRPQPRPEVLPVPDDMPPCGRRLQPRSEALPVPDDMPPCGPRPQPRPEALPVLDDMPPCGPRPQPPPDARRLSGAIELDPDRQGVPEPPKPQVLSEVRKLCERASRQMMLGRTVEAVSTLEQVVQVLPDGDDAYEVWLMLGRLRMNNPAWSVRAMHALRNASRIRPSEAAPWVALGELHSRIGSDSDAMACFRKARELDPSVAIPPAMSLDRARPREGRR